MRKGKPAKHPGELRSHSKAYCSAKSYCIPLVAMANILSYRAVKEKAQKQKQFPWFFTGVMIPYSLQSNELGVGNKTVFLTDEAETEIFDWS